jgi:hypothetical protein
MNRTSKRIKIESHTNSNIDTSNSHRNGDRIRSGHYMTSCLNDDDNNDVEVPIASPDLANDNDVAVTDADEIKDEQPLVTAPTVIATTLQTSTQLQNQTNKHYKNKSQQNATTKLRANDDNNVGMIMANAVVIKPVNLPVKTNDGSISGGLTFDKQNTSLKNLIYYIKHAYSSNLTSPKWKNFKGIKLQVAEKIRLNNVIWRTWFEQYGIRDVSNRKKSLICQFTNVLETTKPPKVTVLEGKYWKRRLDSITTEYKKWRELSRKQIKSINDTQSIQSELSNFDKFAQISNNLINNNNNYNLNNTNNNYSILSNDNNNSICIANSNNNNQQLNQLINSSSMYDNNNLQINVQTSIVNNNNNNSFYLSNTNSLSNNSLTTSSSSSNFNNFYGNNNNASNNNNNVYYSYNNEQNHQLQQQNDIIGSNTNFSNYSSNYNNQFNSITNIGSPFTPMTPANLNSFQQTQQQQQQQHQFSSTNNTKQAPYNNRMRSPSPGLFDFDFFNISSDTLFSTYYNQDAKDTGILFLKKIKYLFLE